MIFQKLVKINIFLTKNKNKHNFKYLRPILMQFPIFISILHSPSATYKKQKKRKENKTKQKQKQTNKKVEEIVFPKLVTLVCFQKGLNPQIIENKEMYRNLYKQQTVKLMWVVGFYMLYLSLTTKSSEFINCKMVILKNGDFLRTLESEFSSHWF